MQVTVKLKDWQIERDENKPIPKIIGHYLLETNGVKIAEQGFNNYGGVDVPFTGELIKKMVEVEKQILTEIQGMLS